MRTHATVSPLARRIRLGVEIRALRGTHTAAEIARKAGLDRSVVSKIEAGDRRAGLDTVLQILDVLPLEPAGTEYRQLQQVARDALRRGWWDDSEYARMGDRQARTANLECGATIREYQTSMLPGLLQTEAYARYRSQVALDSGAEFDLAGTVAGRLRRQEELAQAEGLTYEVVLEPQAIRRLPVPADIMQGQLRHLLTMMTRENVRVRVLPLDAQLGPGYVPRSPFSLYTYPDPTDLVLVDVDTVTDALLISDRQESGRYAQMYDQLRDAALSPEASVDFIQQASDKLGA